jgi:hypothetical protein
MKVIKVLFIVLLSFSPLWTKAQCSIEKDFSIYTLMSIVISEKGNYPIFLIVISENINIEQLDKKDKTEFLESLFAGSYYVPDLVLFYKRLHQKYLDESTESDNCLIFKYNDMIEKGDQVSNIKLVSEETIKINYLRIKCKLYLLKKTEIEDSIKTSIGIDISEIMNIKYCAIPYNIDCKY